MAQIGKSDFDQVNFIDRGLNVVKKSIRIKNHYARELIAEFIGTAFLITIGESAVASKELSRGANGNILSVNMSWGVGVLFAILMTGKISGGLFNPAITITWAFLGRVPWRKVVPYCLAEIAGGFFGAALVYILYHDAFNAFDGGHRQVIGANGTAGIFATYPQDFVTVGTAIFDQVLSTSCLVIAVLAATDPNNGLPPHLVPFAVAFYVMSIGYTFSFNAAGADNPARDLGPRLLTVVAGWGSEVFTYRNQQDFLWSWIPTLMSIPGGILGAIIYNVAIGAHWPEKKSDEDSQSGTPLSNVLATNPAFANIYLSQQSIDFLESLGKRDSSQQLVRTVY